MEEAVEGLEIFGVEGIVDIFFEVEAEFIFEEVHLLGGLPFLETPNYRQPCWCGVT